LPRAVHRQSSAAMRRSERHVDAVRGEFAWLKTSEPRARGRSSARRSARCTRAIEARSVRPGEHTDFSAAFTFSTLLLEI